MFLFCCKTVVKSLIEKGDYTLYLMGTFHLPQKSNRVCMTLPVFKIIFQRLPLTSTLSPSLRPLSPLSIWDSRVQKKEGIVSLLHKVCLLSLLFASPHLYAQDAPSTSRSLEKQASELAKLRAEVEQLHLDLEQMRQETQTEVRALASQKASLSAEIQRARIRGETLKAEKVKKQEFIRKASQKQAALKAPLLKWIQDLKAWTQDHLPYRQEGRTQELDRLIKRLESNLLLPSTALVQVWSWVEDEIKLSKESTMDRVIIRLDQGEVLVDLIRIGMVMMFCRTPQGEYGMSSFSPVKKKWVWTLFSPLSPEAQIAQTAFERFEKKVRLGFFWLPSSLLFSSAQSTSIP